MLPGSLEDALARIRDGAAVADELEGQELEFKQEAQSDALTYREVAETAACLANTDGGYIVIGVADRRSGSAAFLGSRLDPATLRARIRDLTRPPLDVIATSETFSGVPLTVVRVDPSPEFHADTKGRAPRRSGRECHAMDPVQQRSLREGRIALDWSATTTGLDATAADARALLSAREHLRASLRPERRALAELSDLDLLRALGIVADDNHLRAAGQTLVAPEGLTIVYLYKDTPGGEPRQVERLEGPLLVVYDRAMEFIAAHRRLTPLTLPNGQQLQVEDFPELAVREALTNALVHQDFRRREAVQVEHSPQALVVTSPGGLVAGVTVDNILTHPSKPRNRVLADACRVVELAEEVGRGVDRMYREMVRAGQGVPSITDSGDYVRVALTGGAPDLNLARFVAQQPQSFRDDTDAMLVLVYLCTHRIATPDITTTLLQKGPDEVATVLRYLASDDVGLLEPTRETARRSRPSYRLRPNVVRELGTAVPYARHSSAEIETRVVAHLREYRRITNATVRNIFNVGTQRANQILTDLRERGVLTKISDAERGPSVEYGPGPDFPEEPRRRRNRRQAKNDDPQLSFGEAATGSDDAPDLERPR